MSPENKVWYINYNLSNLGQNAHIAHEQGVSWVRTLKTTD